MNVNKKFVSDLINDFYKNNYQNIGNKNYKYKGRREFAWKKCHDLFTEMHNKIKKNNYKLKKNDRDYLSLVLGYYLLQFGMGRKSTLLTDFDYKIHEGILNELFDHKYDVLWDCNPKVACNNADLISNLHFVLQNYYIENDCTCTDTLITKILLGTLCCAPAFDSQLKTGLAELDLCQTFNSKPEELEDFYNNFLDNNKKINNNLPSFRNVDIFFNYFGSILQLFNDTIKRIDEGKVKHANISKVKKIIDKYLNNEYEYHFDDLLDDYNILKSISK